MTKTIETSSTTQASVKANAENALFVLTNAVSSLRQELAETMARKDELLERRVELYAAPLSPADLRQFVGELIDHRAAVYAQRLKDSNFAKDLALPVRNGTPTHLRSPLNLEDVEYALSHRLAIALRSDSLRGEGWELPIFLSYGEFQGWPYFFFGGVIKEKLCALLAEMQGDARPDSEDALSMNARREEIQTITDEIAQLESEAARLRGEIGRLTNPVLISAKRLQDSAGAA